MADTSRKLIEWARKAKQFHEQAGEGADIPDALLMRAAVAYNWLERDEKVAPLDDFERSFVIAMIAANFADDPPGTPERAALFAVVLEGSEVDHG